jgi:hypothetical protein
MDGPYLHALASGVKVLIASAGRSGFIPFGLKVKSLKSKDLWLFVQVYLCKIRKIMKEQQIREALNAHWHASAVGESCKSFIK